MDADRIARLDRADDNRLLLDLDDFAEMNAGRALVGDELAEANMPRKPGYRIVAGRNRLDVAAGRNRKLRIGIAPDKPGERRKRCRGIADLGFSFCIPVPAV